MLARFGPIAHRRIRQDPAPGNASEADVLAIHHRDAVCLMWSIDPVNRRVEAFTAVVRSTVIPEDQNLTGEPVVPGLVLSLRELFALLGG